MLHFYICVQVLKIKIIDKHLLLILFSFRALCLASSEVRFHVDSETHDPIDVQTKEIRFVVLLNSWQAPFILVNIYNM